MRTESSFSKALDSVRATISMSQSSHWVFPTNEGYAISAIEPRAVDLPRFSVAVQYAIDDKSNLVEVNHVKALH